MARQTSACRKKQASCPLAGAHQLFDFALDQVTLERAHVADKKPAVQVVDLMQESTGEQVVARFFKPVPFHILRADSNNIGARDVLAEVGQAEAAFLAVLLAFTA